jgi:hypothetical protein
MLGCWHTLTYDEYNRVLASLQLNYKDAMAIAMIMTSTNGKRPLMPLSQDEALCMIGDSIEILYLILTMA